MVKILCLIDSIVMGGAERQMMGLVRALCRHGYDADLATYIEHNYHDYLHKNYGLDSISLRPNNHRWSKILEVRKLIKENKYKVVISYKDGPNVICCLLKMLGMKFKLIVSERNTTQVLTRYEKIKFWFYQFADFIVPNSYSEERFIIKNFPTYQGKTVTITNYTDTNYFVPIDSQKNEITTVLVVARVARQKNVLRFLDSIQKLKEQKIKLRFKWYGDVLVGEEDYAKDCMDKVKTLELSDYITFYPSSTNILQEYQHCDIFCLPSIFEGYPNVVCEAMSCGKPIVCSDVCDNSTIVKDGENGFLFNPQEVESIVDALKKIKDLPPERLYEMGGASRKFAVSLFSEELFAKKYAKLIEA